MLNMIPLNILSKHESFKNQFLNQDLLKVTINCYNAIKGIIKPFIYTYNIFLIIHRLWDERRRNEADRLADRLIDSLMNASICSSSFFPLKLSI
jgi:hypothetical protein